MNNIQIFQNQEFGAIRTISNEQGEAMFCAKDVAEALGYKLARKAVQDHVDKGDVLKWNTPTTSGNQLMTYINESDLLHLHPVFEIGKRTKIQALGHQRGASLHSQRGWSDGQLVSFFFTPLSSLIKQSRDAASLLLHPPFIS